MTTAQEDEEATDRELEDIMHWFLWHWRDGAFKFSCMLVMTVLFVYCSLYPLYSVGVFGLLFVFLCFQYRKEKKLGRWVDGKPVEEEWGE